jgi:hypothetical protein
MKNILSVIVLVLLVVTACNSDKGEWLKARDANTVSSFDLFLKNHPGSSYADSARIYQDRLLPSGLKIAQCQVGIANKANCEITFSLVLEHKVDSSKIAADAKVGVLLFMTEKIYGGKASVTGITYPANHTTVLSCSFTPASMTNCFGVMNMNVTVSDQEKNTLDKTDVVVDFK